MTKIHSVKGEVSVLIGGVVEYFDIFHCQIVIEVLGECFNNFGFNLMKLMNESKMTLASFGAIFNKIFICSRTDTKGINLAIMVVSSNQIYHFFCIKDCAIRQKIYTPR